MQENVHNDVHNLWIKSPCLHEDCVYNGYMENRIFIRLLPERGFLSRREACGFTEPSMWEVPLAP